CNFGTEPGRVFAGAAGSCTIAVSNAGHAATARGTVSRFRPRALGFLALPGEARDLALSGSLVLVAGGTAGLAIVDAADPAHPALLGTLDGSALGGGSARGVAASEDGSLAAMVLEGQGLAIVDLSVPSAPVLAGFLDEPGARDVEIRGSFAYVADVSRSLVAVALTDPAHPTVTGATPQSSGGLLNDVALAGPLAFGADVFFVNGVPIADLTDPARPVPSAILDFSSERDDNGTGL